MIKMQRRHFLNTLIGSLIAMKHLFSFEKQRSLPGNEILYSQDTTDILVKVLGTAQDGGIPQIACYCKNCLLARKNPQYSRLISSVAILDLKEKKYFLVDATPEIPIQMDIAYERLHPEKSGLKNAPQGVLLTHAHVGHYTGLMFFGYEAMSTQKLPVHCSPRMANFLSKNGPWSQLVNLENISLIELPLDKKYSLTPKVSIIPFQVPHRDEFSDTLGFKISGQKRKLLYIPDIQSWEAWPRKIEEEVRKIDIALLDGTFFSPEEFPERDLSQIGHPFIKKSMEVLKEIPKKGGKAIYFTHINHSNLALNPESEERKEVEEKGFRIASERMEFFL
jgi:pyrroloquinoline quinone biosynthesis protein B